MRHKDPALMERIRDYIGEYYRKHYAVPAVRTIAGAVGLSKSAVHNYLAEMDERGMLSYRDGKVSDVAKMTKTKTGYFSAPLVGSIRCGDPEREEEQVEMYCSLPEALFGTGEFYLLRAVGDSMEDAGISEGDLVLIRKQADCAVGDIVVALDEQKENTLKIYGGVDAANQKAILRYANEKTYPGKRIEVDELVVQGVACQVIRNLQRVR